MSRRSEIARLIVGTVRAAFLSAALFVSAALVPVVGAIAALFAPTPILLFAVGTRAPRLRAAAVILVAAIAATLLGGWVTGLSYAISFGLAAAVMCDMLDRRKPFETIVLVTAAATLAAGVIAAYLMAGSVDQLAASVRAALATGMAHGRDLYKVLGMETGLGRRAESAALDTTMRLTPALVALCAGFGALLNLGLFSRLGGQGRLGYSLFGDLARWSAPEWLIWLLLATGFGMFVPVPALTVAALDAFVCVAAVYFCQGLAIMAFYFRAFSVPPWVRGLIYFVIIVQPVLAALVCAAGIFDLWVDFRRLRPPRREAGNFGDFF